MYPICIKLVLFTFISFIILTKRCLQKSSMQPFTMVVQTSIISLISFRISFQRANKNHAMHIAMFCHVLEVLLKKILKYSRNMILKTNFD